VRRNALIAPSFPYESRNKFTKPGSGQTNKESSAQEYGRFPQVPPNHWRFRAAKTTAMKRFHPQNGQSLPPLDGPQRGSFPSALLI
jgi:hypothetical protein